MMINNLCSENLKTEIHITELLEGTGLQIFRIIQDYRIIYICVKFHKINTRSLFCATSASSPILQMKYMILQDHPPPTILLHFGLKPFLYYESRMTLK